MVRLGCRQEAALDVDCSQSPIFPWDRRERVLPSMAAILTFKCTEGEGVGYYK